LLSVHIIYAYYIIPEQISSPDYVNNENYTYVFSIPVFYTAASLFEVM